MFQKEPTETKMFGVKGYQNCTHDYGSPQSPNEIGHVTYEYPPPPANHYVDNTRPVHHGQDTLRAETHDVRYDRARHASQELSRNFPSKELGQLDIGLLAVNYDNNVSIGEVVKDWYETIYVNETPLTVKLKVDTGAQATVIALPTITKLLPELEVVYFNVILGAYRGSIIPVIGSDGSVTVNCSPIDDYSLNKKN